MAIQDINIGTLANDGTGDDLRTAMQKINSNFDELDLRNDEATTGTNVGVGGHGVFKQKTGYDLEFRKIIEGDRISVTTNGDLITIAANLQGHTFVTDSGSITKADGTSINIFGGTGISTSVVGSNITINNDTGSTSFENNFDFGAVAQGHNSHRDYLQYVVDIDYGTITNSIGSTNLGSI
jgi:hypothetical protein|tara:strand:- start:4568 stop:5110 length:543 start_codon:yes stop_codon:yes gene_type:complete